MACLAKLALGLFQAVSLQYGTVSKAEIERRLRSFEDSNIKREQKLHELFDEAGCPAGNLTEQPVKHSQVPNLICTWPGSSDSQIIVGAHFDFVEAGRGVIDNWSGSSLLPSLLESWKVQPRRHTIVFIAFTDEEKGLVGSKYFVHQLSKVDAAKISAMVNLDSLGSDTTKVELARGNEKLANGLARIAATLKLPLSAVNVHNVGLSDSDSFQDRKIPAINIHSVTTATFPLLHTAGDQMSALRLEDYYDSYLLIRAYLAYLDQTLDAR